MVGTVTSGISYVFDNFCSVLDSSSCVHTAGERENLGVPSVSESSDEDKSFDVGG